MTSLVSGANRVALSGDLGPFVANMTSVALEEGLELVALDLTAPSPAIPNKLSLLFSIPCVDVQGYWSPSTVRDRRLRSDWMSGSHSHATSSAPVVSLYSGGGENRLTLALSDALNPAQVRAQIVEETGCFQCGAVLFEKVAAPICRYSVTLRIDRRAKPFYKVLDDVRAWWEESAKYAPAPVPEIARRPMYSTWYSFHQLLAPETIEAQCRLAKQIGCDAVIVDDGWQTDNNERGYAYCGDWEVFEGKIPDMRAHVARVHEIGLKYILWYSVPFIGVHSKAWARFEDKLLLPLQNPGNFAVLDPRYPEAREYLIDMYERAVRDWDLDGFKLDFVDSFVSNPQPPVHPEQVDTLSVPVAVDRLLSSVIARLSKLKPDICIEFRQSYIGPLMRKFGNMFRSGDCPADAVQNRVNIIDVRLLAGNTATHADMIMWHNEEPVESAALQLLNVLFAVPQISVMLDQVPAEHVKMLRFWLDFWIKYRGVLLDAPIEPTSPEMLYPSVSAEANQTRIAVDYGAGIVRGRGLSEGSYFHNMIVVNAKRTPGVYVENIPFDESHVAMFDCMGNVVRNGLASFDFKGPDVKLEIPPSGLAIITA